MGTCSETEQLRGSLQVYCLGIEALTSHPELQKGPKPGQGRSAADGRYVLSPGLPNLPPSLELFMVLRGYCRGQWGGWRGQGPPFRPGITATGTREAVEHSGKHLGSGLKCRFEPRPHPLSENVALDELGNLSVPKFPH